MHRERYDLPVIVAVALALCLAAAEPPPLTEGVKTIATPGIPGTLAVFGSRAWSVVSLNAGGVREPVVAAGELKRGRVVAFGHDGYLTAFAVGDTGRLLANAARWAGRGTRRPLLIWADQLRTPFANLGLTSDIGSFNDLIPRQHVAVLPGGSLTPEQVKSLRTFVEQGGGLVTGVTGWGWQQLSGGRSLTHLPINTLLASAGLVFTDGMAEPGNDGRTDLDPAALAPRHAGESLDRAKKSESFPGDQRLLVRAVASIPDSLTMHWPEVVRLAGDPLQVEWPVEAKNAVDRLRVALAVRRGRVPPEWAKVFPGAVKGEPIASTSTAVLRAGTHGWRSTGLYLPPGVKSRVRVRGEAPAGLQLRIGAHTDSIWHLDRWDRAPVVATALPLRSEWTDVSWPFGGLVYVDVPAEAREREFVLEAEGVVRAPRYVLGETSPEEWKVERSHPGPWAEIEGKRLIHTIPSDWIRDREDLREIAEFWDRVTDACADLATSPRNRSLKERIVADVQISAGYMHAGYPIMTHLDTRDFVLKPEQGSWGHFHEIGHNHQSDLWTFEGTVEVTVNLFTLYVYDTILGKRPDDRTFRGTANVDRWRKFVAEGGTHRQWMADPFLALVMYAQLQDAFGWESYKRVFAAYRDLPEIRRPRSEQEKRDQWMVRFSKAVGRNLGPFFEAWKVPVSAEAKAQVADLPTWMPEGMGGEHGS